MSLRILLSGASGYMGRVVSSLAAADDSIEIAAGFDLNDTPYADFRIYSDLSGEIPETDVIIDFSHPSAFDKIYDYAKRTKTPIVFATTGLSSEQTERIRVLSEYVPVFSSANMSIGVNLLIDAARKLAISTNGMFDIEIIEKHHRRKVDAPSGTAIRIAEAINQVLPEKYDFVYDRESRSLARPDKEIGISSVRGGTIVGEHSVIFAGYDEIIEIKHTALSRNIFAVGAVKAAKFISGKQPGLYTMDNLFGGE